MRIQDKKNNLPFLFLGSSCLSFILGIIAAYYVSLPFVLTYSLAFILSVTSLVIKARRRLSTNILIASFFFVGMSHVYNFSSLEKSDIFYYARQGVKTAALEGVVVSQPSEKNNRISFVFRPRSIIYGGSSLAASGFVLVQSYRQVDIEYGDALSIRGKLSLIKENSFFNRLLVKKRIRASLALKSFKKLVADGKGFLDFRRTCFSIRQRLKERLGTLPYPSNEFLKVMLLADRSGLGHEIISVFRYTGTVHILAISGLHIGIIVFIVLVFLKALRIKQRARFFITVVFLIAYCFMIDFRPSVVRAVVMAVTFLLSFIAGRQYQVYNSLGLAAAVILGFAPWQVFDVGFQLSFISVLSIVTIGPVIMRFLPGQDNKVRLFYFIRLSLIVSFSIWLGTFPLAAHYFGVVAPVSMFANVLIVALIPFIIGSGFVFLIFSFFCPPLAHFIALSIEFMIELLLLTAALFSKVPFAFFYTDRFTLPVVAAYYFLLFAVLIYIKLKFNQF